MAIQASVFAGFVAFDLYVVIALLTGTGLGAALLGGIVLGAAVFMIAFGVLRVLAARRHIRD